MTRQGVEHHRRGAHLARRRIAGDVRGADVDNVQQVSVYRGLALPDVDDGVADKAALYGLLERVVVGDGAARGVDEDGGATELAEEGAVGEVVCGVLALACQRGVEGDDVGLAGDVVEGAPAVAAIAALTGRVAQQHAHTQSLGPLLHESSDVAYTHYTKHILVDGTVYQLRDGGKDVLRDGRGVAAWGVDGSDAVA